MKIVAVIPARSGSKSIPDKNIQPLGGKPLMAWSIETAKKLLEYVYVSTDSEEYMSIAKNLGAEIIPRPSYLAEDVPTEWVIWHALNYLGLGCFDDSWVVTIQPTTPLFSVDDLQFCISLSTTGKYDSVISVVEAKEHPEWLFEKCLSPTAEYLVPAFGQHTAGPWGIRQTLGTYYRPNGAIYVTSVKLLRTEFKLIGNRCGFHEMPQERSLDVDTPFDLELLRAWVERSHA